MTTAVIGKNASRKEGPEKLCGAARYIDDYALENCLYGVTFRSSIPRGKIKNIHFDGNFDWKDVVIAGAKDIPGSNHVALIEQDQPLLADQNIRHSQEPILLVAHASRHQAYEALKHIHVEYEELPPVLSIEESLAGREIIYGKDNIFKSFLIEKGNVETGLAQADVVVAGEYRVPHQEQAYIENNGMAAWFEKGGVLVTMGSLQCPYYVQKALMPIFNLPNEKVRVIQATTGGGFGGKEEYPNMIAGHAALLALKSGRPVKMIYDRVEDMAATTKRHPAIVRHRTGVTRQGKLVAQDIEVIMDGGAYATLSSVVLSRGTLHAAGPYECPNVRVRSKVVATNTPPNGAFRGFGAPQTLFAAELQMEKIAKAAGIDSLTLRRRNCFKTGSITATSQRLQESVGAGEVLERCVAKSGYERRRREYAKWNRQKDKPAWKGLGLSLVFHGAGFTGSGEVYLASRAGVALTSKGKIEVLAASTEIGQGTSTMFAQIAADTLGVPYEWIEVQNPDTGLVPNSGPTVASRTCMIVGGLLKRSCEELKRATEQAMGKFPKTKHGLKAAARKLCHGNPRRLFITQYEKPNEIQWDDQKYQGDAYGVYSYAACVVDLEIDRDTFEVRVNKLTTAQDIGRAMNPLLAEGQIIGGTTQGLGWALCENVIYKNGVMANPQLTNYIIPTSLDTPPMDVMIVEKPYSHGPFGAKGVGELPMDGPGPAVAAAVFHATGLWISELPILPEKILRISRENHR